MSELAIITFSFLYKVLKYDLEFKNQHYIKKALPLCPALLLFLSVCSSGVNESRQVLQEQPDFAQSLLREPNTPVIRKSRGTSTQVSLQTAKLFSHLILNIVTSF